MIGQVESILEGLYNDISINKEDKEELENSCNNFMLEELEKIKITLSSRVNEFCKGEMKKMKDKKMDRFNKNMNDITINTCRFIADEFDLDEDEVIEQNKDNLLKINDYHEVYKQNYVDNDDVDDDTLLSFDSEPSDGDSSASSSEHSDSTSHSNCQGRKKRTLSGNEKSCSTNRTTRTKRSSLQMAVSKKSSSSEGAGNL